MFGWNTIQKVSDRFGPGLIKQAFEPNVRVNEIHSLDGIDTVEVIGSIPVAPTLLPILIQ